MIKPFWALSLIALLTSPVTKAQSSQPENTRAAVEQLHSVQRLSLLSDLRSFDEQGRGLKPLGRAALKAEIADAAWALDAGWAKVLLARAYELTLPDENERENLPEIKKGARPVPPSPAERARSSVRREVLRVAGRDKAFANELVRRSIERLGPPAVQMSYVNLADSAREQNDLDAAGEFLMQAIDIDPSQIAAAGVIAKIAKTDRERADQLILEHLARLRQFPLSGGNQSVARILFALITMIFPGADVPPPGPAVMRAYVSYTIHSFGDWENREPGILVHFRTSLLRAWPVLTEHAPDLAPDFLLLERRSRNENVPPVSVAENKSGNNSARSAKDNTRSNEDEPLERKIHEAMRHNDFPRARKLIDKLDDASRKSDLTETANAREALYFLKKDDLIQATVLAEKLKRATSIREVYPALIGHCVSSKDEFCAANLMVKAIKQIKESDPSLDPGIPGLPAFAIPNDSEFDAVLDGLGSLTRAVHPISADVALLGLSEIIAAANISKVDSGEGRIGFDLKVIRTLAPRNESRVRQAAESLKDPFRRLISLAAIYQWKVADFEKTSMLAKTRQ